jgi:hypothetical protein
MQQPVSLSLRGNHGTFTLHSTPKTTYILYVRFHTEDVLLPFIPVCATAHKQYSPTLCIASFHVS